MSHCHDIGFTTLFMHIISVTNVKQISTTIVKHFCLSLQKIEDTINKV